MLRLHQLELSTEDTPTSFRAEYFDNFPINFLLKALFVMKTALKLSQTAKMIPRTSYKTVSNSISMDLLCKASDIYLWDGLTPKSKTYNCGSSTRIINFIKKVEALGKIFITFWEIFRKFQTLRKKLQG